jgi:hypothetical protein
MVQYNIIIGRNITLTVVYIFNIKMTNLFQFLLLLNKMNGQM